MTINPLLARFQNEPAFLAPHCRDLFESHMAEAAKMYEKASAIEPVANSDFWTELGESWSKLFRPYKVENGVLQIPVRGSLLKNFPYQFGGYATGYEYVSKALDRGMSDPDVKGLALVLDSPGGMVAGNFELVDKIYSLRGKKPIKAFASDSAYSAAYNIASAADDIVVTRSGGVGSIGVVTMHVDASEAMGKAGYKVTFIYAGKHKVDGNAFESLPKSVKERIQERIDSLYDVFVATVARNRGIEEKAVRDTEALTFTATEAISNKLADAIGSLDDGLAAFAANLNSKKGETTMSKQQDEPVVDQAKIDAAHAEGLAKGTTDGAVAERARVKGIMALDETKNRHAAALNIALETNLSVDQAKGLLATLPTEKAEEDKPAAKTNAFDSAMSGSENPNVGADSRASESKSAKDEILADYSAISGVKIKKA